MHASGYMVEADYDGGVLTARGTNRAGRVALAGADYGTDVVLARAQIAGVELKRASRLVNGNLTVTAVDGRKFQLHFRHKSAAEFDALHAALAS